MKKRIKAIIFDVGGVLQLKKSFYKNKPIQNNKKNFILGVHEYVSSRLGLSIDQYFDSIDNVYPKTFEGKIPEKQAIQQLAINLKTTPKKLRKLYKKAYKKNFKLNKPLLKFIKKLKKNYKIAVLSDMWYLSKQILTPKSLLKKFDVAIISCDVGYRKPSLEIYKLVLKKLNVKPSETIFIDNQSWNLVPAKKLKMKTILFKDNKQLYKELAKQGIYDT